MLIKFWGVRGSIPTPQIENLWYGGNTPCIEIRSDNGNLLIIDCGSGLRLLGRHLAAERGSRPLEADILLSHYHWDHIQGLPFFVPLYSQINRFHFHALESKETDLRQVLEGQMQTPYFPVEMRSLPAKCRFSSIGETSFSLKDFKVTTKLLNHPQGCLAFRIESGGRTLVYASDNEPGDKKGDHNVREIARGADMLIYDAQFTPQQLTKDKKGWGHSSWEEGVRICEEVEAKQMVLYHHDPDRADNLVDEILQMALKKFSVAQAAREGMEIKI